MLCGSDWDPGPPIENVAKALLHGVNVIVTIRLTSKNADDLSFLRSSQTTITESNCHEIGKVYSGQYICNTSYSPTYLRNISELEHTI